MNPQPRRQRGEKAVHDRLYHQAQVSMQQKIMKQREAELADRQRPLTARQKKTESVI